MMQVIAEHLNKNFYSNFLLLNDYIVTEYIKSNVIRIGSYLYEYSKIVYFYTDVDLTETIEKYGEEYIILKKRFAITSLEIKPLNKYYKFDNGKFIIYKNGEIQIKWNNKGEVSYIDFGRERVHFNINDIENVLMYYFDFPDKEIFQNIYSILYEKNEFYDDRFKNGFRYKLFYYNNSNLPNLLVINKRRDINKLNELIHKLNIIRNDPFSNVLPEL